MLPLLVLRQNIYTDPQRPMQAEAKIYEFGNPGPDAPFFVTTNFSLTYFIVAGEIEASKVPAYLGIVESEGLSVLTAWAAGKFVPERIAKFVNDSGIAEKIGSREVIIPGVGRADQRRARRGARRLEGHRRSGARPPTSPHSSSDGPARPVMNRLCGEQHGRAQTDNEQFDEPLRSKAGLSRRAARTARSTSTCPATSRPSPRADSPTPWRSSSIATRCLPCVGASACARARTVVGDATSTTRSRSRQLKRAAADFGVYPIERPA